MNGKRIVVVGVILILIIGLGYLGVRWFTNKNQDPYHTFIKPRLELSAFEIKNMQKNETTMDMKMLIDNPSPLGFEIDSLSYKIYISDKEVLKSTYPKSVTFKGNDSSVITLPVTIPTQKLIKTLKGLKDKNKDSVEYKIKASFYTNIPFLKEKPLFIEFAKVAPLFILPEVKILQAKVEKIGLKEFKVNVKTEVNNENIFPFVFKETSFIFNIDEDQVSEMRIDSVINIPAYQKKQLEFPIHIATKEAGEAIIDLITKPKEVDYHYVFATKLVAKDKSLKDSKFLAEDKGKLKDLIKNM